jgi:CBS domain-containing protein
VLDSDMSPTIAGLVPVTDIMTRDVISVREGHSLAAVIDLVIANYIGCVPIVDEDARPIGMITKRDLVEPLASRAQAGDPTAQTAKDVMLPLAITLGERATVLQAAAIMAIEDLHHIPIVSPKGQLIGVVSSLDIVRWLARNDGVLATVRAAT